MGKRVVMAWSGGKDSALALYSLLDDPRIDVVGLLTTVTETYERVSMHGVRIDLVRRQAASLGLPLIEAWIPPECTTEIYESRMAEAFRHPLVSGADAMASGDIFLEDVRAYREERVRGAGKEALFPIWGKPSTELAAAFIDSGFRAMLACVDPRQIDPALCGREFDRSLLAELAPSVDSCGENGEFHTFVYDAPYFSRPIPVTRGEIVDRSGFTFQDLVMEGTHISRVMSRST